MNNDLKRSIDIVKSECYIADLMSLDRTRIINKAIDTVIKAAEGNGYISRSDLEDRLDAVHEKIQDSCMEYFIDGRRHMFVDADDAAEVIYEVLDNDIE